MHIKQVGRKFCIFDGSRDTGKYAYTRVKAERIARQLAPLRGVEPRGRTVRAPRRQNPHGRGPPRG